MPLLRAVIAVNEGQPGEVLRLLHRHFPSLTGRRIGILGLAFKPDTDDVRESPAMPIIRQLLAEHASLRAYDPVAMPEARKVLPEGAVVYAGTLAECVEGVDAVVLATRWAEFEKVPDLLRAMATPPLLVDGRRQLDKHSVGRYEGIGL